MKTTLDTGRYMGLKPHVYITYNSAMKPNVFVINTILVLHCKKKIRAYKSRSHLRNKIMCLHKENCMFF